MGQLKRQLSIACVGADFPNKKGPTRRFEIAVCKPGDRVELEPEPKNKADANAILVLSERGVCMGYVLADRTSLIHRAWGEGIVVKAVFQRKSDFGCWIRVSLDESAPEIDEDEGARPPSPRYQQPHEADPDSGFWPDFVPPDD